MASPRTDDRRNGPGRESAPHRSTGTEWPGPGSGYELKHTAKSRKNPPPKTRYYDLEDDDSVSELRGSRPDRLAGVKPQERVQRHTVEQIDLVPLPMVDAPEPLMVYQLPEFMKIGVVQVLQVPEISQDSIPQRKLLWCQVAARGRGPLVADGHTPRRVGPSCWIHLQPSAVYKYWAGLRRWRCGRPCDHAAPVPAVLRL